MLSIFTEPNGIKSKIYDHSNTIVFFRFGHAVNWISVQIYFKAFEHLSKNMNYILAQYRKKSREIACAPQVARAS